MSKIISKHLIGDSAVSFSDAALISAPFTQVQNRALMRDLSRDLKVNFGIDRLPCQQLIELPGEFGSNGERVFGVLNDNRDMIRLVGNWNYTNDSNGSRPATVTVNDYAEITFYGTGLNLLGNLVSSADIRVTVDGGSEGSNILNATYSTNISGRNYSNNNILQIVSGLAVGVHTVKIRNNTTNGMNFSGIEILFESSALRINQGTYVRDQKRYGLDASTTAAFKPSALTGGRGGRVVVYSTGNAIGTAVQAVDTTQKNLTSADHTVEDIARIYYWREFGAGRSDDFSSITTAPAGSAAFTLEDGTTTLAVDSYYARIQSAGQLTSGTNGTNLYYTFVGTGLDIIQQDEGNTGTTNVNVLIDGTNVGALNFTPSIIARRTKIVSGLPYGTHTVRFNQTSGSSNFGLQKFIVYQPKKPSIPSGANELADYNVMATFVANTVQSVETSSTGVLRKVNARECVFVEGTGGSSNWGCALSIGSDISGFNSQTDRVNASVAYTFTGTGFDFRFTGNSNRTGSVQVSLNGTNLTATNFPTAVFNSYGAAAFTSSTGILSETSGGSTPGSGFAVSNLPYGTYTVKFLNNTASSRLDFTAIDLIVPTHSYRNNLYGDLQNTLPIGSCSLSDSRQIISGVTQNKAWAQAAGVTSGATTSGSVFLLCPDMSVTINARSTLLEISYNMVVYGNNGARNDFKVMLDGVQVGTIKSQTGNGSQNCVSDLLVVPVSVGTHKIELQGYNNGNGTITYDQVGRTLLVREL